MIETTIDEDTISEDPSVEDDDVTITVFAVVAGTTGEDVTFEVSVIDAVTVDDNVTFGGVEVLEVRACSDVSSGICVARVVATADVFSRVSAFVAVPRETTIYNGTLS